MEYTPEEVKAYYKKVFEDIWPLAYYVSIDLGPEKQMELIGQTISEIYEEEENLLDYETYTSDYINCFGPIIPTKK